MLTKTKQTVGGKWSEIKRLQGQGKSLPRLFKSIYSCSTSPRVRWLNLWVTYLHSSFYQLSARSQAHRCICNCPVCSHSAAHTHHCPAGNIHPSLSGENQSKSHFPDHPNTLIFLMQLFWTEGTEPWLLSQVCGAGTAAKLTSAETLLTPEP